MTNFISMIKEVAISERDIVFAYRSRGFMFPRPSSLILTLLCVFYIQSPIKLIPRIFTPFPFWMIDVILLIIIVSVFCSNDIIEFLNLMISKNHESEPESEPELVVNLSKLESVNVESEVDAHEI